MRTYIKIFCLVACTLFFDINAQECRQASGDQGPEPPVLYGSINNWQPNNNITIPINFIFLKPPTGPGMFDTVTDATCNYLINFYNNVYGNLQLPTLPLPSPYTAPFLSDTKITFVFKSRQLVISGEYNDPADSINAWPAYYPSDSTALNIVWNASLYHGNSGASSGIPSNVIYVLADHFQTNPYWSFLNGGVMNMHIHEIGHALGLYHSGPNPASNKFGTVLRGAPVDDYWYEDIRQFGKWGDSLNKAQNYPDSANNIMGYTWPARNYLSPKQISYIHYTYWNSNVWKKISNCSLSNGWILGGNNTLSGTLHPPGDIIIPYGAHTIITGIVQMKEGAKIIVEPHGKLTINGGIIMNACGRNWKGIELQSQSSGLQTINSVNGMPTGGVGMLVMNGASIINADIGVFVGTKGTNNQTWPLSGGGILNCTNSTFKNNRIGIQFTPYYVSSFSPFATDNISSLSKTEFIINSEYTQMQSPEAAIYITSTFKIDILGCLFRNWKPMTAMGIKNWNGSFILKNYVGSSTVRNKFEGFKYAIYSTNWLLNSPSIIRNVIFNNRDSINSSNNVFNYSRGSIYMMNNFGTEITGCEFYNLKNSFNNVSTGNAYSYALYFDHCDGYIVENNFFEGYQFGSSSTGAIFVSESGPGANAIYNNVIKYYAQGIWAQNVNYDAITGAGLLMNCNDFTSTTYNIGVQAQYLGPSCVNCPIPLQNGGVAAAQGVYNPLNDQESVRNTYHSNVSCSTENKFFVNTPNNAFFTAHGSFLGNQYHPTPQPLCSNNIEVIDVVGTNPPQGLRSFWCPVTNYGNKTQSELLIELSSIKNDLVSLKSEIAKVDGGTSKNLLQMVSDGQSAMRLKDSLLTKPYLSDSVLIAYFSMSDNTYNSFKQIIEMQAPLPPKVWLSLNDLSLDSNQRAHIDSLQFTQNKLNDRMKLEAELTLKINKHDLLNNERIRRFLNDSTPQVDSALAIMAESYDPERDFKIVDLLIAAGRYSTATNKIDLLSTKPANAAFCTVMNYIKDMQSDSCKTHSLAGDTVVRSTLRSYLGSNNRRVDGYARVLLNQLFGEVDQEITMRPDSSSQNARAAVNVVAQLNAVERAEPILNEFILFPNPTSGYFTLKGPKADSEIELQITTTGNMLVVKHSCKTDCVVNLNGLPNGIYFVHLFKEGKPLGVKKLVLIK